MISLVISSNNLELTARLDQLPTRLRAAITKKLETVVAQIEGKYRSTLPKFMIQSGVEVQGSLAIAYFEPDDPKSIAREFGGKGYYPIYPSKARLLRFLGRDGKLVFTDAVWHPPSREFRDIRDALEAEMPSVKTMILEAMGESTRGR